MPRPSAWIARQALAGFASRLLDAGSLLEGGKHDMHAACSREGRHTQRPDRLLSLLLPDNDHMHTKRGTYTSPRMRVQSVLTPAKESAEKGMFLGQRAGGGGCEEGGRQQTGWPAAQTITKMGSEIFKDAVAAPSTELWLGCIFLPGHAWSPGAPWPSEKG